MLSHHPIAAPVTLVLVVLLVLPQQTTAAPSFPTYTSQFNMTQEIWVAGTSRTLITRPMERGVGAPHQFSLWAAACYLLLLQNVPSHQSHSGPVSGGVVLRYDTD